MTIQYSEEVKRLAHEILMGAGKAYTEQQRKEIPLIINAKSRYFWGNDLNDHEVLGDVFTAEGFQLQRGVDHLLRDGSHSGALHDGRHTGKAGA